MSTFQGPLITLTLTAARLNPQFPYPNIYIYIYIYVPKYEPQFPFQFPFCFPFDSPFLEVIFLKPNP